LKLSKTKHSQREEHYEIITENNSVLFPTESIYKTAKGHFYAQFEILTKELGRKHRYMSRDPYISGL